MTNMEFYREEIEAISEMDEVVAVLKGKPQKCSSIKCEDCDFNGLGCSIKITKWLMAEHIEEPTITSKEKGMLEAVKYKYIARDKDGWLRVFKEKPVKYEDAWGKGEHWSRVSNMFDVKFPFIKWEDEEPWAVEDLLKLEVKG